jgi:peptide/nickel transport system substrate-binding protein
MRRIFQNNPDQRCSAHDESGQHADGEVFVRQTRKAPLRIVVLGVALALVVAACGSSSKSSSSGGGSNNSTGKKGGALVFGAEQWPSCINPITQCANSSWLQWLVPIHVLPRLAELDDHNNFVASPLLKELPSTSNGGVTGTGDKFTVTYHLNPDAKWDDGSAITSSDVQFSWRAVLDSTGSVTTAGYDQITSVDTPDPQTAVVHFKVTYNDWPDVMGGFSGVILQKSKFPAGTNTGKTMQQSIDFSGGPWKLQSFSKDKEVLVRNESYWDKDRLPLLDSVTFVPLTETTKEVQALKTGQVAAIYPQPAVDNVPQLTGNDIKTSFGSTTQYENIWFNQKPGKPFEDKNLRAAFTYAFDRALFLNDIVKPFDPTVTMLNCAAWLPTVGSWCTDPQPWADVQPDASKVEQYMTASGYAKDSSGFWAKGGKVPTLKWMANTGNKRREDTQAEFIPLMAKQGFKIVPDNSDADTVFQKRLPAGDYDFSMFIQVTSPDPTVTSILSCDNIPAPANKGQGQNDWWYCNKDADALMKASDAEQDPAKRQQQIHDLDNILRQDFLNLPLYAFPALGAWQPSQVTGPISQYINNPESFFWNMWAWSKP